MGRKSKQKGANFERQVAKILNKEFGTDKIRRTPLSGGLGIKGDLCTLESNFELPGPLSDWCIECKNQESPRIWKWIEQARSQSGIKKWILIFTRNQEENIVCMSFNDWIELVQKGNL